MKERAEKMTQTGVQLMLKAAGEWIASTGEVLDQMESTHDEHELAMNSAYQAMLAEHTGLCRMTEEINNQLNKKR